jgi:hypothetical protein
MAQSYSKKARQYAKEKQLPLVTIAWDCRHLKGGKAGGAWEIAGSTSLEVLEQAKALMKAMNESQG